MKIILVTRFYPPDTGGGGIASYAYYAAHGLSKAGHHVRIISAMVKGSTPRQIVDGIEVFRIPQRLGSYLLTRLPLVGRQMRLIRDLIYAYQIRKLLLNISKSEKPDLVEYADIDAEGFFHPRTLCPYVIKLHSSHVILKRFYKNNELSYSHWGIEKLESIAVRNAAGISSPSRYLAREIQNEMKISPNRIEYVPNFIDTQSWSPYQAYPRSLNILYVGRIEEMKGALVFANAIPTIARAVPDARFIFLGGQGFENKSGISKNKIIKIIEQNNLQAKVEFHGHSSPENFLNFYRRATIFVLPSLFENSPYTLLEAMATGKACVVSRGSGMTEMLAEGNSGLFFSLGDSDDLAQKVINLILDERGRNELGQAARKIAEKMYSLEVGTQKTLTFYQSVLVNNK